IAERALGAAEMSGTSDYIGSAAHSCSLSNLIHRAGLAHEIYSWLCRGLDHRCRRCGPGYVHPPASPSSSIIQINPFAFSDMSDTKRKWEKKWRINKGKSASVMVVTERSPCAAPYKIASLYEVSACCRMDGSRCPLYPRKQTSELGGRFSARPSMKNFCEQVI